MPVENRMQIGDVPNSTSSPPKLPLHGKYRPLGNLVVGSKPLHTKYVLGWTRNRGQWLAANYLLSDRDSKVLIEHRTWRTKQEATRLWELGLKRERSLNAAIRRRNVPGTYTRLDIEQITRRQGGVCATPWCGTDVRGSGPHRHIDHKIPISRGGTNWPGNLQVLCAFCNCSKGDLTNEEWVALGRPRRRA